MKCTITAVPAYNITLTASEFKLLKACAEIHYDQTCRNAFTAHGLMGIWQYAYSEAVQEGIAMTAYCTEREIQTCCKILEMPFPTYKKEAQALTNILHSCMNAARRDVYPLTFEVEMP